MSHWLPTGHWHAPYPPACMYAICRELVRVAVYRERDAARRTVLLYTAFVILIIKRIKRKSQERNSRSTTRHAQECKEERRGITREGRSWTTFLFWREELNVTQDKSAHTNARKRRAHWNERNLGPAESPTQKKKMKKKSKKKNKKKGTIGDGGALAAATAVSLSLSLLFLAFSHSRVYNQMCGNGSSLYKNPIHIFDRQSQEFLFLFFFLKSGKRSKTLHIWVCYSCGWRQSFILFHSGWRVERKQQQPPKKRKKPKRRDAVCVAQVNSFLIFIFYFIFFLKGTSSIDLIFVRGWCVGEESL